MLYDTKSLYMEIHVVYMCTASCNVQEKGEQGMRKDFAQTRENRCCTQELRDLPTVGVTVFSVNFHLIFKQNMVCLAAYVHSFQMRILIEFECLF